MPQLMKGVKWKDRPKHITYPIFGEVKHDEIRCHVIVKDSGDVEFLSFAGKPLANMQSFARRFVRLACMCGFTEFDCGFRAGGNFNNSYRWVRSTKGVPKDLMGASIEFFLYDLPQCAEPFIARRETIKYICGFTTWLQMTYGRTIYNAEDAEVFFREQRDLGHEGAMFKTLDHLYERKRSKNWIKMKPEEDADGVIVELLEAHASVADPELGIAVGDPLGRIGSVRVLCEDGSEATPHGIPHALGIHMLKHPEEYIGEWCEFNYMERDRQGGYRHPTWHRLREAKK